MNLMRKFTKFNFINFKLYSSFLAFARDSSAFGLRMTLSFCHPERSEGSLNLFQNRSRNPFQKPFQKPFQDSSCLSYPSPFSLTSFIDFSSSVLTPINSTDKANPSISFKITEKAAGILGFFIFSPLIIEL